MNKTMTTRPTIQMILFTILSFGRTGLRTSQQRTAQVAHLTETTFNHPCVSEQWGAFSKDKRPSIAAKPLNLLVGRAGLEPATKGL